MNLSSWFLIGVVGVLSAGCGEDERRREPEPVDPPPPAECGPGEVELAAGGCRPAGLPPEAPACPAGSGDDGGDCQAAGIPASRCAEGFAPDGAQSCTAMLPRACDPGQMAVPGDARCRPVAPCGTAPWGDIPTDASTEHVDGSALVAAPDGSPAKPWPTVQQAIDAAAPGAVVAIAQGVYPEELVLEGKAVVLWGRCPELVSLAAPSAVSVVLGIQEDAAGSEVHDLAITGGTTGVYVNRAGGVRLERVWVHDGGGISVRGPSRETGVTVAASLVEETEGAAVALDHDGSARLEASVLRGAGARGVFAEDGSEVTIERTVIERAREIGVLAFASRVEMEASLVRDCQAVGGNLGRGVHIQGGAASGGPASATLRGSIIERCRESGLTVVASDVVLEATAVRDTKPHGDGSFGWGAVVVNDTGGERGHLSASWSVFDGNHETGVLVSGSDAELSTTAVRRTLAENGWGVAAQSDEVIGQPATLALRGVLVEDSGQYGVLVLGSDATIDDTLVRATRPGDDPRLEDAGIMVQDDETRPASLSASRSVIEQNSDAGVMVNASEATLEATIVRGTVDAEGGAFAGRGVHVQDGLIRSHVAMRSCLVEDNEEGGLVVIGSDVEVDGTVVRRSLPRADGTDGRGISAQVNPDTSSRSLLTVTRSLVEDNRGAGILVIGADGVVERTLVRGTLAQVAGELYGDGIVATSLVAAATLSVRASRVEASFRVGVSTFGAHLALGDTELDCNAIDLAGETFEGKSPTFEDLGENRCGCSDTQIACAVETVGLDAPTAD